jgi:hypothetical protein
MANKTVTVGPGKTYASLQAAITGEVAANANLVTMNGILNIELYAFADTTPATVTGFTVDATRYVNIYTDPTARHVGVWDAAKYTLTRTTNGVAFTVNTSYTRVMGLQISSSPSTNTSTDSSGVNIATSDTLAVTAAYNIIRCTQPTFGQQSWGIETNGWNTGGAHKIYNNIIYGFSTTAAGTGGILIQDVTASYVYNNTICGCKTAIRITPGVSTPYIYAINNIIYNCTTLFNSDVTITSASGYNATEAASWGTGYAGFTGDRLSQTFSFVNAGGSNFLLKVTDTGAYKFGTNLSANAGCPFNMDVTGTSRSVPWSIGADQPFLSPAFLLLLTNS